MREMQAMYVTYECKIDQIKNKMIKFLFTVFL